VFTATMPVALCYDLQGNRVYCASERCANVAVIDGASDSVVKTVTVGFRPAALVFNPTQNRVCVANSEQNSISVIRDSALGVAQRSPAVGRRVALDVFPNPFSGQVRLQLTADGLRPEVRIYDVNGALVRDFGATRSLAPSLPYSFTWDGTDDLGRLLPNGVYLVRVTDGSRSASRQVLLLR
jgi:YVTN family beta-propeller protein